MSEEGMFLTFRICILLCALITFHNMKNNRSAGKRASMFYKLLLMTLPLLVMNSAAYLFGLSGEKYLIFATSASILYYLFYTVMVFMLFIYSGKYLNLDLADKGKFWAAFRFAPVIFYLVAGILDRTQTAAFGVLLVFIELSHLDSMNKMVSLDPLTRLNNRNELRGFLKVKLENPSSRKKICVMMMDMNGFKAINDTYGHVEGDKALKRVAMCLKRSCADVPSRPFIARYGGDEFTIVMETESDLEAERLSEMISMTITLENNKAKAPYQLNMCIGMARWNSNMKTALDLIDAADLQLYEKKSRRRGKEKKRALA